MKYESEYQDNEKMSSEIMSYFLDYKRFSSCFREIEWYEEW